MPLVDAPTDRRNKILIRGGGAAGLILAAFAVYTFVRPAIQIEEPDGDVLFTLSDHGAIGVRSGSGVSFGTLNHCLKSGGSSVATLTWGTCGSGGGGGGGLSFTGNVLTLMHAATANTVSGSHIRITSDLNSLYGATRISATTITGSTVWGVTSLRSSGALTWEGAGSGASLYLSQFLNAPVRDRGGQVCNVKAYGAVGDDSTDDYAAITAAIAGCPQGGIVYFPPGVYRISQELRVNRRNTTLQGTHAPRWQYRAGSPTALKPTASFSGSAIIHIFEHTITGEAETNDGGRITHIAIDGNSYGTNVAGIYFEGLVRDWTLEDVDISQTTFDGFRSTRGAGTGYPRGFTIRRLSVYSNGRHGFRGDSLTDSYLEDVLAVDNDERGIYLSSPSETKIVSSRAVFNNSEGLYIDGQAEVGGFQIDGFSTDRNGYHGIRISETGTGTITMTNILTRRDGNVSGPEEPYAGLAIIGSAGPENVVPVVVEGLAQTVGVGDDGSGTVSPHTGVRVQSGSYVKISGQLWGVTQAFFDGGENDFFFIEEDSVMKTGYNSTETTFLYNAKWVLTSSGANGLIEYPGTASGRRLHANNLFTSSGAGIFEGNITMNSITSPSTLQLLLNSDSAGDYASVVRWKGETTTNVFQGGYWQYDAANNEFIGGVHNAGDASTTTDLEMMQFSRDGTRIDVLPFMSGSIIHTENTLASSGTVVWEGSGSGRTLTVSNTATLGAILALSLKSCYYIASDSSGNFTCGTAPVRTVILTGVGAVPSVQSGSTAKTLTFATNNVTERVQEFGETGDRYAEWTNVALPNWNGGTITATFYWTTTATTNDIEWSMRCISLGDGDAIDTAWGTAQSVADTAGTANTLRISSATSAITCAGTPASGEKIAVQVYRDSADAQDTMAGSGRLIDVLVRYTTSAISD